jgi:putative pre-16S rRNA nuclease
MGLDVGDRWIGVALSDPGGILASPLTIIDRTARKDDVEAILEIAGQRDVASLVVGLPRAMDGTIGQQAEKVQEFAHRLSSKTALPIEFRDERLSTISAGRLMQESGKRKRGKARDDAAAAAVILQSYLDEVRQRADDSKGGRT